MGYILIALTVALSVGCSCLMQTLGNKSSRSHKQDKPYAFSIDANNATMEEYVSKMSEQHKTNSRVISGNGKMHYVETVVAGSKAITDKSMSIIKNLGDRFS